MNPSISLLILIIITTSISSFNTSHASIESTCMAASKTSPNVNYDFCLTTLKSDPKSHSADTKGLAIISTELTSTNASSTKTKIAALLLHAKDQATKSILETCAGVYSEMMDNLKLSMDAIEGGRYGDAVTYLSAALTEPGTCEDSFSEKGVNSLVAQEDKDALELSAMALAITSSLR
ncbi:Pectinesterase protein [Dioscorea alata]|uniref:Pectinesterase protein n=1 Tax=Dioscorea alata TaxID=55571 RepID=A0ACB7WGN0_DIOAL|nr:Pectinesterase protein [Dioscorea alata]